MGIENGDKNSCWISAPLHMHFLFASDVNG